jgi:DNA-directed RNA polymerase specialized sigma24 family protein
VSADRMAYAEANDPDVLRHYEGLVHRTAQLLAPYVEMEREDIEQVLRVKVWRALLSFDPARSRTNRDRYVFMCVRDQAKDVAKRVRRNELHIADLVTEDGGTPGDAFAHGHTPDRFDARYLSESHEEVYGVVEADEVVVPSTLTSLERQVVVLLYRDRTQAEAARELGIHKREMEKCVRSIRTKMADWNPGIGDDLDASSRGTLELAA